LFGVHKDHKFEKLNQSEKDLRNSM